MARIYVGSVDLFHGGTIILERECACLQCWQQGRDRKFLLVELNGRRAQLQHVRPASIRDTEDQ